MTTLLAFSWTSRLALSSKIPSGYFCTWFKVISMGTACNMSFTGQWESTTAFNCLMVSVSAGDSTVKVPSILGAWACSSHGAQFLSLCTFSIFYHLWVFWVALFWCRYEPQLFLMLSGTFPISRPFVGDWPRFLLKPARTVSSTAKKPRKSMWPVRSTDTRVNGTPMALAKALVVISWHAPKEKSKISTWAPAEGLYRLILQSQQYCLGCLEMVPQALNGFKESDCITVKW